MDEMKATLRSDVATPAQQASRGKAPRVLPQLRWARRPRDLPLPGGRQPSHPSPGAAALGAAARSRPGAPLDGLLDKLETRPEAISAEERALIRDLMLRAARDVYQRQAVRAAAAVPYRPGVVEGLAFSLFVTVWMWLAMGWAAWTLI